VACGIVIAAALIVSHGLRAPQEVSADPQRNHFRSAVDLVTLHVTVTDRAGNYLNDVDKHEFIVFENGRRQDLVLFQETGLPLAMTLVLDTSSSVRHAFSEVQDMAVSFLRQLLPDDVASVMSFGDTVRVLHTFTRDRVALETAVRHAKAIGGTALYDALYIALKELNTPQIDDRDVPRRRVAMVLSDGDDTSSLVDFNDLVELAARSDVAVYAIRMGSTNPGSNQQNEARFVLRRLANQTGGRAFFSMNLNELRRALLDVRMELSRQYALAYVSSDPRNDGLFRSLSVEVTRTGARARTRRGYIAPGASGTAGR
jgi:Ca-activated chloride channel family protein